jgi:two-component system, OmpR family, alkaline phosphatase synthesis response regulator PhoP
LTRKKVLLIEDEEDIREIASLSLESIGGWETILASDGRLGIEQARLHRPDAILLDVMMPGMDGPTTLTCLRSTPETRDIPVIFMTAKVMSSERSKLAGLGVQGFIAKPFDPLTLPAEIRAVLGWSRS